MCPGPVPAVGLGLQCRRTPTRGRVYIMEASLRSGALHGLLEKQFRVSLGTGWGASGDLVGALDREMGQNHRLSNKTWCCYAEEMYPPPPPWAQEVQRDGSAEPTGSTCTWQPITSGPVVFLLSTITHLHVHLVQHVISNLIPGPIPGASGASRNNSTDADRKKKENSVSTNWAETGKTKKIYFLKEIHEGSKVQRYFLRTPTRWRSSPVFKPWRLFVIQHVRPVNLGVWTV